MCSEACIIKLFYGRNKLCCVISYGLCYCQSLLVGLTDTLAFSVSELNTAVKSFMIQAPGIVKLNIVTPLVKILIINTHLCWLYPC
jgi:hypothetical protein